MATSHGEQRTDRGWTVDTSTFGARLALVRHRMNWNVKEAARECGVPAASWRSWEEGAQPRRLFEIVELISRRTGADYMWLLVGDRAEALPGSGGANTLHHRQRAERTIKPVTARSHRSAAESTKSTSHPGSHKPDIGRHDPRRPRILPRPVAGTA